MPSNWSTCKRPWSLTRTWCTKRFLKRLATQTSSSPSCRRLNTDRFCCRQARETTRRSRRLRSSEQSRRSHRWSQIKHQTFMVGCFRVGSEPLVMFIPKNVQSRVDYHTANRSDMHSSWTWKKLERFNDLVVEHPMAEEHRCTLVQSPWVKVFWCLVVESPSRG